MTEPNNPQQAHPKEPEVTPEEVRDDPLFSRGDEEGPVQPISPGIPAPRLTVIEKVYHQVPGENTKGPPPSRYYRWLESDEEAYTRTIKVGTEWQPIDMGWLKSAEGYSLLKLINATKRLPALRPSATELEEFYSRILEIGIEVSEGRVVEIGYIPVGEDMRLAPLNMERYRIRSRVNQTKYTIYLIPI